MSDILDENGQTIEDSPTQGETPIWDEDGPSGVTLTAEDLVVSTFFSSPTVTAFVPVELTVEDLVVTPVFSSPTVFSGVVDLTVEDLIVTPVFSSPTVSQTPPVELTVEDLVASTFFSTPEIKSITGLIKISATAVI